MSKKLDDYYEPELGQAVFGQPYKQFGVSAQLESAMVAIETRLMLKMGLIDKNFESPFRNTGSKFYCDTFLVEAYSWNDEYDQEWNFKWRDLEVSWYKHLGRGMSANRKVSDKEITEMLDECYDAIRRYEAHDDQPA